ncbi:hypothetical protein HW132_02230 [Brasilonema sp. CT11]|nr:hypothetical protein [Brasilonema sp. CT11]
MTDIEIIQSAIKSTQEEIEQLRAKRTSKANTRKIEECEIKLVNLSAFFNLVEKGGFLASLYVAKSMGEEVHKIYQVFDNGEVELETFQDEVFKANLSDLMYDEKATSESPAIDSVVILRSGEECKLVRLIYPGQIEVEGKSGLIPSSDWTLSNVAVPEEFAVLPQQEENQKQLPEGVPKVVFLDTPIEKIVGSYRFIIGKTEQDDYIGQLFEVLSKQESQLVIQTEPSKRFHWVRSVLVLKYHQDKKPLQAGDKLNFDPWLLAFPSENQEAYHPTDDEEDVSDIQEDLMSGKPILQAVGVSTNGETFSGYRRTLAAINAGLETIPIDVRQFETRVEFIEALFDANKTRDKTPEIKAREREIRFKYCSDEAKQAQLARLRDPSSTKNPLALGSAWERTVANEPDISPSTAAAQSRILQFIDHSPDREMATKIREVFNSGDKKTKTCEDLIKYSQHAPADAKIAADMILNGDASSVPKAIAKNNKLSPFAKRETPEGVHIPPSGTIPPNRAESTQSFSPVLPPNLMRLVANTLGRIDIDILSADASSDATHHFTGASDKLDALKADWQIPGKRGACKVFGCLYVDNLLEWIQALSAQWVKGNIAEAVIFVANPVLSVRNALKGIAAASGEILFPVELTVANQFYAKAEITVYYLGGSWRKFANIFEPFADVRVRRWAFEPNITPLAFDDSELHWQESTNGSSAQYKGIRLSIIEAMDGSWYAEVNGQKISENLESEAQAKTIAATAAEQLSAA